MKAKKKTVEFDYFYEVFYIRLAIVEFLSEHPDTPNKLVLRSFLDLLRTVSKAVDKE